MEVAQEVLLRARAGDRAAFRQVMEALAKTAFNIAWRMTYNATDAEDLAQEIFMRLFQNLKQYDPQYPFTPWFRRLASNCCINWKQKVANRTMAPLADIEPGVAGDEPADPDVRLRNAINELPPEYQMCVTLKYLESLGVNEIAETMKVPVGTVKTWLFRARDLLKEKLKPHLERMT